MAKKGKVEVPGPSSVANRDILQRMNFLYQASAFLSNLTEEPHKPQAEPHKPQVKPPDDTANQQEYVLHSWRSWHSHVLSAQQIRKRQKQLERRKIRHPKTCADLSQTYIRSMKAIGKKTTVRL